MTYLQNTPPVASSSEASSHVTISRLQNMREMNEKIAVLTCYDASFSALMDDCGIDVLLIGDSLGNVIQGHQTTLPVTLEDMLYHLRCVKRGAQRAFLLVDMPFASYLTPEQACSQAAQLMRAGAHMVKLEGGAWLVETVRFMVERGIPVCAHIGLQPQSVHALGGFKVQGKNQADAARIKADALALQAAGAKLLVLEAIPAALATDITTALHIPTIGIGAGTGCSGQVLVMHDLLGLSKSAPKFVKDFMQGQSSIAAAINTYITEVKTGIFPGTEHSFS